MLKNNYGEYVVSKLTERDLLEQLAEEANELSKACLKLIRAKGLSNNTTPKTEDQVAEEFMEEIRDVMSVLYLLEELPSDYEIETYWKFRRWAKRLGYKDEQQL